MGISERAKDFIGKLLDKDPNNRIDMDEITNHPFLAEHRSEFTKHL
jgi:serine/threonine protein kinase